MECYASTESALFQFFMRMVPPEARQIVMSLSWYILASSAISLILSTHRGWLHFAFLAPFSVRASVHLFAEYDAAREGLGETALL